jgi:exodeoxyribonuclease-5
MCRSPVLVWRNQTRVRLIGAFRKSYAIVDGALKKGEPLICDGIELPSKHRKRKIDLEDRGLIKGAQVIYIGEGKKNGFCKFYVVGASDPIVSVASIVQMERVDKQSPDILSAAGMGAVFVHGAATTIHKAQGSQWANVQIFGPDLAASARSGLIESQVPLWKRLAYVAVTRAQEKIFWVTQYKMAKPKTELNIADLALPELINTQLND